MVKPKPRRCLSQHWERVVRATISLAAGITSPRLIQYLTKTETIQRSNIQTEVREASYGTRDRVHREVEGREPVRHHPNDQKVWGGQGAWRVLAARQHAAKPKEKNSVFAEDGIEKTEPTLIQKPTDFSALARA